MDLRERHEGPVVPEARHGSWFEGDAEGLLGERGVARVAADPPRAEEDEEPGGHRGIAYFRLRGTPWR